MDEVRTFIATPLRLPEPWLCLIDDLQNELKSESIKWVNLAQLHITLRFLGDIPVSIVPRISKALEESCTDLEGGDVTFSRLGYFGSKRAPRVLWLGMEPADILYYLKEKVDQAISGLVPDEETRPFRPHLTLARIRQIHSPDVFHRILGDYNDALRKYGADQAGLNMASDRNREGGKVSVTIDRLVFFKSELQKKGPIYSPLNTIIIR